MTPKKESVHTITDSLKKKATGIGCVLVVHSHAFMPYSVIGIIPDNSISRKRFELGVTDGAVHVIVQHSDMDKKAVKGKEIAEIANKWATSVIICRSLDSI